MSKTYHILSIFDYKGGELGATLNLDYEEFISYLGELLHFYSFINENEDFRNGENEVTYIAENAYLREGLDTGDLVNWIEDSRSIYGGGENCWFLYECENNTMTEIELTDLMLEQAVEAYIKQSE